MKKFLILMAMLLLFPISCFSKERINVAFTIDNNYPIYTLLAINSILTNNISSSDYTFYIVENNLTDKNKNKMKNYVEQRGQKIEFINIDTNKIDGGTYLFAFSNRITPIGMARIMLPKLLPENIHRVLYLDGDILVTSDLSEFYNADLGKFYVGMSENISKAYFDFEKHDDIYFNSGVILMDLDKWRKESYSDKLFSYLNNNKKRFIYTKDAPSGSIFLYPDQDLINVVLMKKIKKFNQKWNNQTIYGHTLAPVADGGIIHYIGPQKPWTFERLTDPVHKMYYEYWNNSGLVEYKYYYYCNSLIRIYIDNCKKRLKRYNIFSKIKLKRVN